MEEKRIRDFVIAIDTSASTKDGLVRRFIEKTYAILEQETSFFADMNVLIVQCDAAVTDVAHIANLRDLDAYLDDLEIKGLGGTDFRPVFAYVDDAVERGELANLGGLIYFTDGQGTYPGPQARLRHRVRLRRRRVSRRQPPRARLGHEGGARRNRHSGRRPAGSRRVASALERIAMDIRQAKDQIKNAMVAYFSKDEFGNYRLPTERQRPVFLLGAPGIGKTAIMEQIAQDLDVGFVSYSMTHHTRQSALGLPFIAKKTYDGVEYDVSEYTMSEIIAAVYDAMEATGKREGILFLDEINCVSETLTPAMLQFLQYKIFGRHRVPDGWIVVTAGNPPEYNRTAHDFDIATWDRLKRIDVEPDFAAWRDFAVETGVHPAVLTYLDIERDHFYRVETTVDGKSFVTARGWDDLSAMMKLYEEQGIPGRRAADRPVRAERRDREALQRVLRPVHEVPRRLPDRPHPGPARPTLP